MNEEWAGSLQNSFQQTVTLGEENILYREAELFEQNINDVRPFNQALSDAEQPIQAVRTYEGLHIMQGNNRVYGAVLDDKTIQTERDRLHPGAMESTHWNGLQSELVHTKTDDFAWQTITH